MRWIRLSNRCHCCRVVAAKYKLLALKLRRPKSGNTPPTPPTLPCALKKKKNPDDDPREKRLEAFLREALYLQMMEWCHQHAPCFSAMQSNPAHKHKSSCATRKDSNLQTCIRWWSKCWCSKVSSSLVLFCFLKCKGMFLAAVNFYHFIYASLYIITEDGSFRCMLHIVALI